MTEKTAKVLIVDDQDLNLRLLGRILREGGFETVSAYDGDEVVEVLEANPDIGAILLDRMMPNVNGIEALKQLKALPAYRHLPVIMATALWSVEEENMAAEAGAFAYLRKPYDKVKIIKSVQAALEKPAAVSK